MAKDATPDEIELKDENFANENHQEVAAILADKWSAEATFTDLGDEYDHHRATFQNVYSRYFGVAESDFNDGLDDERTISQLKDQYGSYSDYRDAREYGAVTTETPHVTALEQGNESDRPESIDSDGFAEGWNMALERAKEVGIENVPQMN